MHQDIRVAWLKEEKEKERSVVVGQAGLIDKGPELATHGTYTLQP